MDIAILGYGTVGKGVEEIALANGMNVSHILMRDIDELYKKNMTRDLDEILGDDKLDCVIECIGGDEPAHSYVAKALEHGKNVVSSNKKMLVKHLDELLSLARKNDVTLLFSAACGGGIPWLRESSTIREMEDINSFKGIMNGTSNYILDRMYKEGTEFTVALKSAQELGYAEADPSDDIDGIDTANKVILSAAIAFKKTFKLEDVFIRGIRHFNLKDLAFAKQNGYKCILLGKGIKKEDDHILTVLPTFVKKDSVLGNINDNFNCFILDSDYLGELTFIGQGAGSLPTASNVIRDVFSLEEPYVIDPQGRADTDIKTDKRVYYVRSMNKIDESYVRERIDEECIITEPVSIEVLQSLIEEDDFTGEIDL